MLWTLWSADIFLISKNGLDLTVLIVAFRFNQSINQSINQPINQSDKQSIVIYSSCNFGIISQFNKDDYKAPISPIINQSTNHCFSPRGQASAIT